MEDDQDGRDALDRGELRRIAVIGAGAWGTTIASVLSERAEVRLWGREPEVVEAINTRHRNDLFLPDHELSPGLRATEAIDAALDAADVVLVAVPAEHFRSVIVDARPSVPSTTPVLSLTKGIEQGSALRMTEVLTEVLAGHRPDRIGVLSGPNIAAQVVAGRPAATVVSVPDAGWAWVLQDTLMTPTLRVYTNTDVVGSEIGGAVKNVIALAAGMALGLDLGENAVAALITRGLAEMTRLGVALGADPLTFLGLAGIGDLMVTCQARSSRNNRVGTLLAEGVALDDILASMKAVAEGVRSCGPVLALGRRVGVELPICDQVSQVLHGDRSPDAVLSALFDRLPTGELHDLPNGRRSPSSGL